MSRVTAVAASSVTDRAESVTVIVLASAGTAVT